ncbi:MAG: filamentous hemagglutinin N-terminal domain-containing protein, partial [Sphingomonas sp.]|nr:filamentous hemagglutinin N-terminal domain-containing protein [Sphingomonas sp.]
MRRRAVIVGASALALLATYPARAQTAITPDSQAGVTTGTTATTAGTTTIIDGGRRIGDNLFHSFTGFSLGAGDSAIWERSGGDGGSIANIINRVTGGAVSTIDGTITSQGLDRANFFFINPAGIVFGANASVAVPNAAYFSTANALRFADGGTFGVTTPGGSTFS